MCPKRKKTRKEMINEKVRLETGLTYNVLPVVIPFQ